MESEACELRRYHSEPVELKCRLGNETIATFLVWYPAGQDRIHMLVPREHVTGRA